jgi:hypothetical protein
VAHKVARLVVEDDGVPALCGVGWSLTYAPDDTAQCIPLSTVYPLLGVAWGAYGAEEHDAPDLAHGCGFYAVADPARLVELTNTYRAAQLALTVELYGRVIRHRSGYRAERQRVLGAALLHRCARQGFFEAARWDARNRPGATLPEPCGPATHVVQSEALVTTPNGCIELLCDRCAGHNLARTVRLWTPAELSGALGVEVTWS